MRDTETEISAFVNITNPETGGYPYLESIKSYSELADEIVVVDGGTTDGSLEKIRKIPKVKVIEGETWDRDFDWNIIGRNQQIGYENCQYNWRMLFAVDFILHEKYINKIKEEVKTAKKSQPAIFIDRINVLNRERAVSRGDTPWLVNSGHVAPLGYGRNSEHSSFASPIIIKGQDRNGYYGEAINKDNSGGMMSGAKIYCYDYFFMIAEQIKEQRERFNSSMMRFEGRKPFTRKIYYELFLKQARERMKHSSPFGDHSKHIKGKINKMTPEMWGYNNWNLI